MFSCNYHTHTKRCGHATGEDEDYVLEAIGQGFRTLGFSDHAMLPDFSEPYKRGDYSLFQGYCDSIDALKKKYKDQIEILLGFEAESFPMYFSYYFRPSGLFPFLHRQLRCRLPEGVQGDD